MNYLKPTFSTRAVPRAQAGFTIVEMMVAMAISLVVMLGFAATFVNMKQTFNSQNGLTLLQDNERLASLILNSSLDEAGYFPTGANPAATPKVPPTTVDRTGIIATPLTTGYGGNMGATLYIFGSPPNSTTTPPTPETISTAYLSAPGDGLSTCQGGTNTGASNVSIRNIFYVDSNTNTFGCVVLANGSTSTAPGSLFQPLISSVQSMSVLYGVDTNGDKNIDSYLAAKDMAPYWSNVKNVQITLNFINPNAKLGGAAAATIAWTQTVNLMNNKQ
jgi:type IV pilus assembly protein PilW